MDLASELFKRKAGESHNMRSALSVIEQSEHGKADYTVRAAETARATIAPNCVYPGPIYVNSIII